VSRRERQSVNRSRLDANKEGALIAQASARRARWKFLEDLVSAANRATRRSCRDRIEYMDGTLVSSAALIPLLNATRTAR
jgi:hypothetical protein